jgi:hypothetical protein
MSTHPGVGRRWPALTRTRLVLFAGVVAAVAGTLIFGLAAGGASINPNLGRNSHAALDNGKPLPHVSGGSEVTFDEERQQAGDTQGSAGTADLPPDATASALGCANRGSATNPRVNQDCTLRRQAEEFVAVNPLDSTNVVAGQNDSRVGFNHCGFDYSLNSGQTWGDGLPPFYQHTNPATGHTYDAASDPAITFNGNGVAWFSCVVFDVNSPATAVFAVPSTVALKGAAYSNVSDGPSKFVVAEAADNSTFYDKEFIAGDPRSNHSDVYITFTKFVSQPKCAIGIHNPGGYCSSEIMLSHWTAASQKWSTPISISGNAPFCVGGNTFDKQAAPDACNFDQGSYPVVDPSDGSVFVACSNGNTPTLVNQTLGRRISFDSSGAVTMGSVVRMGSEDDRNDANCDLGRGPETCVKSLLVRTNEYPALAIDPTNHNHLVSVWQDSRNSPAGAGLYDVVVSESTDGGATWTDNTANPSSSTAIVLKGATGEAYFEPAVTITKSGKTAVSFYRANPYAGTDGMGTYGYGLQSRSTGTFGAYTPVSDSQTDPSPQANPTQRGFLGDYSNIAASSAAGSNTVYPIWSDTRNASASLGPDEDIFIKSVALP